MEKGDRAESFICLRVTESVPGTELADRILHRITELSKTKMIQTYLGPKKLRLTRAHPCLTDAGKEIMPT